MASDLVFYTNPMSRGRIVRWMLEEVGAPYRTEVLQYGTTMKAPEYLAVNPMGKVPALVHNGKVVTETAAICMYLADVFPAAGLAPPIADRAAYYRWFVYFAGAFEAAVVNRSLGLEVPKDKERMIGYGSFTSVMDAVEKQVSARPFIAGDVFTAADVYCGSQIGWGLEFGSIDKRPAFADYWSRISDRPARIRAAELDDALIPKERG
jgi:glutathione S-transferase